MPANLNDAHTLPLENITAQAKDLPNTIQLDNFLFAASLKLKEEFVRDFTGLSRQLKKAAGTFSEKFKGQTELSYLEYREGLNIQKDRIGSLKETMLEKVDFFIETAQVPQEVREAMKKDLYAFIDQYALEHEAALQEEFNKNLKEKVVIAEVKRIKQAIAANFNIPETRGSSFEGMVQSQAEKIDNLEIKEAVLKSINQNTSQHTSMLKKRLNEIASSEQAFCDGVARFFENIRQSAQNSEDGEVHTVCKELLADINIKQIERLTTNPFKKFLDKQEIDWERDTEEMLTIMASDQFKERVALMFTFTLKNAALEGAITVEKNKIAQALIDLKGLEEKSEKVIGAEKLLLEKNHKFRDFGFILLTQRVPRYQLFLNDYKKDLHGFHFPLWKKAVSSYDFISEALKMFNKIIGHNLFVTGLDKMKLNQDKAQYLNLLNSNKKNRIEQFKQEKIQSFTSTYEVIMGIAPSQQKVNELGFNLEKKNSTELNLDSKFSRIKAEFIQKLDVALDEIKSNQNSLESIQRVLDNLNQVKQKALDDGQALHSEERLQDLKTFCDLFMQERERTLQQAFTISAQRKAIQDDKKEEVVVASVEKSPEGAFLLYSPVSEKSAHTLSVESAEEDAAELKRKRHLHATLKEFIGTPQGADFFNSLEDTKGRLKAALLKEETGVNKNSELIGLYKQYLEYLESAQFNNAKEDPFKDFQGIKELNDDHAAKILQILKSPAYQERLVAMTTLTLMYARMEDVFTKIKNEQKSSFSFRIKSVFNDVDLNAESSWKGLVETKCQIANPFQALLRLKMSISATVDHFKNSDNIKAVEETTRTFDAVVGMIQKLKTYNQYVHLTPLEINKKKKEIQNFEKQLNSNSLSPLERRRCQATISEHAQVLNIGKEMVEKLNDKKSIISFERIAVILKEIFTGIKAPQEQTKASSPLKPFTQHKVSLLSGFVDSLVSLLDDPVPPCNASPQTTLPMGNSAQTIFLNNPKGSPVSSPNLASAS